MAAHSCIMTHAQEYAKHKDNLEFFLTYADNNAVGYFTKQGFTKEITMPRDRVRTRKHTCTRVHTLAVGGVHQGLRRWHAHGGVAAPHHRLHTLCSHAARAAQGVGRCHSRLFQQPRGAQGAHVWRPGHASATYAKQHPRCLCHSHVLAIITRNCPLGVIEAGYKEQPELYSLVLQGRAVPPDREHLQVGR